MKRIIPFLLVFYLLFSLSACALLVNLPFVTGGSGGTMSESVPSGGTQAHEIENKVDLRIDKSAYEKSERIEVTLDFSKMKQNEAVIVIVASDSAHGNEATVHDDDKHEEYRWLADFSELPFYLWAPDKDGVFDIRVYADGDGGDELASVTFTVGNAALPTQSTVNNPPVDGSTVKTAFFNPPKAIYMDVQVSGSTVTEGKYSFALLNGNYSYTLNPDGVFFHISAEKKTCYCPYGNGWVIDNDDYGYGNVPEEKLIYEMIAYLDTFFEDAETNSYSNNIAKYYIGTEIICSRECRVYERKDDGFGVYKKFWVDPENGATLKYIEREGSQTKYEFEVTQYNLSGPVWTDKMRPDYTAVTKTLF